MYKKILVAYDGSEGSQAALDHAAELAELHHSVLILTHVMKEKRQPSAQPLYRIPYGGGDAGTETSVKEDPPKGSIIDNGKGAFLLRKARNRLALPDWQIHTEVLQGDPAKKIIELAEIKEANLIIMGNRGIGGFRHRMLGSVSQKVAQHADCPVLIVK